MLMDFPRSRQNRLASKKAQGVNPMIHTHSWCRTLRLGRDPVTLNGNARAKETFLTYHIPNNRKYGSLRYPGGVEGSPGRPCVAPPALRLVTSSPVVFAMLRSGHSKDRHELQGILFPSHKFTTCLARPGISPYFCFLPPP